MKKNVLFVLSNVSEIDENHKTGIWLEEFTVPYIRLKDAEFNLTVASPEGGLVTVDAASLPETPNPETDFVCELLDKTEKLSDLDYNDYDAVVVPGGHAAMIDLAGNIDVAKLLGLFFYEKKLIATICHGASALISARRKDNHPIVEGKDVTAFSNEEEKEAEMNSVVPFSLENKLKELGADYSCGKPFSSYVLEDDNLITAQNPQSAEDFAKAIIEKLTEKED